MSKSSKTLVEILEDKKGTYHNYALDTIEEAVNEWLKQFRTGVSTWGLIDYLIQNISNKEVEKL